MKKSLFLIVIVSVLLSLTLSAFAQFPTIRLRAQRIGVPASDTDAVSIYFAPNGPTEGFDNDWDFAKLINTAPTFCNIYAIIPGYILSIDGLPPLVTSRYVTLGFGAITSGTHSIQAVQVSDFPNNVNIYLIDSTLHKKKRLDTIISPTSPIYKFTFNTTDKETRFYLYFKFNSTSPLSATITPQGPISFCSGSSVKLDANTGTNYTYQWKRDGVNIVDGTVSATTSTYTANTSGSYTVIVSQNTDKVTSSAVVVTVNPLPTATISGTVSVCQNAASPNITLTGAAGTAPYTFTYKLNGGANTQINTTSGNSVTIAVPTTTAGTNVYTLVSVSDNKGCSQTQSGTATVTVNPSPAANTGTGKTICAGASTSLGAAAVGGDTYSWTSNPAGFTSSIANPTVNPTITTTYTLTETITSSGCQKTNTVITTVNPTPPATATTVDPIPFCDGESALLIANTGAGLSYQWKLNGGDINGATKSSYSASIAGSFSVVVSNSQGCSNTSTPPIITSIIPVPPNSIIVFGSTTICQGDTAWLGVTASDINTFQWNRDDKPIIGANETVYAASIAGSYTVVMITDAGCFATSDPVVITVNTLPNAVITPAGSTSFCQGSSVILNANTGNGLTYQWKNGANLIPGATNSSYTANANGSYTVYESSNLCKYAASTSAPVTVTVNPLPPAIITAGGSVSFCQGNSVLMTASSGFTYQWKKDGNNISGETSSSFAARTEGIYSVNITNSLTGCSSLSNEISVTVNPLPAANTGSAKAVCFGASVPIGATAVSGNTYNWTSNPAGFTSTVANPSVNPTVNSTYTLTEKITSTGCQNTNSVIVTVNELPEANAGSNIAICSGKSTSVGASSVIGDTYSWTSDPVGFTSTEAEPSVSPTVTTTYSLTETITSTGCQKTNSVIVTIKQLPGALLNAMDTTTFCIGDSVLLVNGKHNAGLTYQWMKNSSDISGATNSSLNVNEAGSYTFKVTDNNTGCSQTAALIDITVIPLPSVTINLSGPLTLCQTDSIILNATPNSASAFQWQKNGADLTGETNSSFVIYQNGFYGVEVNNGCGTAFSDIANIRVKPKPIVDLGIDDTLCKNQHVILDAGKGYKVYKWSNFETSQTIYVDTTKIGLGKFTFSVTVTDSLGCSGSDSVNVFINDCMGISKAKHQTSDIRVFPNPNDGLFYLTINQPSVKSVKIYLFNLAGQEILNNILYNESGIFNKRLDISEYSKGLYILKIESNLSIEFRKILFK